MNRIITTILCWQLCSASMGQIITVNTPFPFNSLPAELQHTINKTKGPSIIEVFSIHCTVGFTSLPQLETLRGQYSGRIGFYLVAKKDKYIEETYKQFEKLYSLKIPIAYDSLFFARYKSPYLPLFFWIDGAGIVKDITGPGELTTDNINRFLAGRIITVQKYTPQSNPIGFLKDLNLDSTTMLHAEFKRWNVGDPVSIPHLFYNKAKYLQALGIPADQLIQLAFTGQILRLPGDSLYGKLFPIPIFNAVADSIIDLSVKYNYQVGFSRSQMARTLQEAAQEDVARALSIDVKLEYRTMPYWSLTALNADTTLISTKHSENRGNYNHAEINITNCSRPILINLLQRYYVLEPPIIDETGMLGNVDVNIEGVLSDRNSLQLALKSNGFELSQKRKLMQVVVIYAKN